MTLLMVFCLPKHTWGQCNFKFDYSIKKNNAESDISITLTGEEGDYIFQLYDLYKGEVVEKKQYKFINEEAALIFEDVSASTYTIYVTRKDCENHITLGKHGLVVEGNN